ncbi:MAG TPA: SMI1/KNR4 family protein [Pirellulaceae bacterium]|nr:SMI1/KNR4 family protein [Pirellulaceae bacterium]
MIRRLAQPLGVLALAACVLLTALGGLSHWRGILMGRIGPQHTVLIRSTYGKAQIDIHRTDAREPTLWIWSTWPHEFAFREPNLGGWWRHGGFGLAQGGTRGGNTVQQITLPYWSLTLISLLLASGLLLAGPKQAQQQGVRDWKQSEFADHCNAASTASSLDVELVKRTETKLSRKLPLGYVARMCGDNGGAVAAARDKWSLYPIFDDSDKKRLERTYNDIVRETAEARQCPEFPPDAVAIGHNSGGDKLVFMADAEAGRYADAVYRWDHKTGKLKQVAAEFEQLKPA